MPSYQDEIVYAALERHRAQCSLENAAQSGAPSWTMRQRQRAVNEADRKISAYATLIAEEINARSNGASEKLSEDEKKARAAALADARQRELDERTQRGGQ